MFNLIKRILIVLALVSVLLFTWGIGGYFVSYQITLHQCIRDFEGTGAVVVLFSNAYCTKTYEGESMIVPLSDLKSLEEVNEQSSLLSP